MFVSKVRQDGVFDGLVEFPDGTTCIPSGHSFSLPPEIPAGHHAIMMGGWKLVEGPVPQWPPAPTVDQLHQQVSATIQQRLDEFAQSRGYDNILSACSYASSAVLTFQQEGLRCVEMRDLMWSTLYTIMDEIQSGQRPTPAEAEIIEADLPALTWN